MDRLIRVKFFEVLDRQANTDAWLAMKRIELGVERCEDNRSYNDMVIAQAYLDEMVEFLRQFLLK